jgi:hypothetical protein
MHSQTLHKRSSDLYSVCDCIGTVDKDKDNSTSSVQIGYQILKTCKQLFSIFDKLFVHIDDFLSQNNCKKKLKIAKG